jgi:hypothetical protein
MNTARLAHIDQQIAETQALTAQPAADETLERVTATLAEPREARRRIEARLDKRGRINNTLV